MGHSGHTRPHQYSDGAFKHSVWEEVDFVPAQMATVLGIRREYEVAVEGLGFSLSLECDVRIVSFEVEAGFSQDSTQPSFRPCRTFASCCDPGTGASADRCGSESFASTFRKTGAHMGSWAPGSDAVGAEKLATSRAVPSHLEASFVSYCTKW